ncbi:hypothetical protein [Pseudomonas aeruginosa]|uniref:hypothetical protein n=1 Tax=Pseudomonas aeruginosa TaxID=287 RepID=UPI001A9CCB82|nr:hypothetical protein [Pseudomonas aeruginosa]QTB73515.1 hypothetical protein LYSZa5_24870 [Pseudomonas aeruginosa]QTB85655.1 hypothetical protein LYSZa2_24870 [Pseudomonas aeruginosa]
MPKYEVIKPWNGVSKGQVLELDTLAAALLPNVREVGALRNGSLTLDVSAQVDEAARQALAEARASVDAMIDEAKAQAEGIIAAANAEAVSIREQAKAQAEGIIAAANAEAVSIREQAKAQAEGIIAAANAEAVSIREQAKAQAGTLTPAIPDGSERRELIKARLKELKIEFDGRQGEEALAALLPEGELAKLFPAK